ncbi:unnamed protein product, partial [Mesorhabditis spiculigera]
MEQVVHGADEMCYDENLVRRYTPCPRALHSCALVYIEDHPTHKLHHLCVDDARPHVTIHPEFTRADLRHPMDERVQTMSRGDGEWQVSPSCISHMERVIHGDVTINGTLYQASMICCKKSTRCDKLIDHVFRQELYQGWPIHAATITFATFHAVMSIPVVWGWYQRMRKTKQE